MRHLPLFLFLLAYSVALHANEIKGTVYVFTKGDMKLLETLDNSIIYLTGIETPPPKEIAISEQKHGKFSPRLLPVIKGQTVQFYNRDNEKHQLFLKDGKDNYDFKMFSKEQSREILFDQVGKFILYSNTHKRMIADILVLENTYFSLTDKNGKYYIKDIPSGDYTLHAWHIYGGHKKVSVHIKPKTLTVNFRLDSILTPQEVRNHLDKNNKKYPLPYLKPKF